MRREKTKLYLERAVRFLDRIRERAVLERRCPLSARFACTREPVPFADREKLEYRPVEVGATWGRDFDCGWFHVSGRVPDDWAGECVALHLDLNGEACVFDEEGAPVYGMTNGSVFSMEGGKDLYRFLPECSGGELVEFWIETGANNLFGLTLDADPPENCPQRHGSYAGKVVCLELAVFKEEIWRLALDLDVLMSLIEGLNDSASPRSNSVLRIVNRAIDAYADDARNAMSARELLKQAFDVPADPADLSVTVVGHAHIDTGWLWPVRETVRKCGRTFASQLALIEKYPGYVFGASQPEHYRMVKRQYPALYDRIKKAVEQGRWECQGAMWVESDCNIIGGESMVRQFLHGKNFFKDEFGIDVRNVWLPDVFGYSAAMPQIMKKCGVDSIVTQKISWSRFNEFPFNTFMWQGIDGTKVLAHFPPENEYNSSGRPQPHIRAQKRFKENGFLTEYLSLCGIGDGGCGPQEEHVERVLRQKDLNGTPRLSFGKASDFLGRMLQHAVELETWAGELYLELHRGTLTTQARTKLGNRRLENRLRDVEMIFSMAPAEDYPAAELDALWKTLMINQFHDIVPGSGIARVYRETETQYAQALSECDELIARAAERLTDGHTDAVTLFNTLNIPYTTPVLLPGEWTGNTALDAEGAEIPSQPVDNGRLAHVDIPANGSVTLKKGRAPATELRQLGSLVLENGLVRYEFDRDGTIMSALDKEAGRSIIPDNGKGNVFGLYVDRPVKWDAWDIEAYYTDELLEHAAVRTEPETRHGPVCGEIKFFLSIGKSTIEQTARLSNRSKRLDFLTRAEWREKHRMLRVSFRTVINADRASFDIQYGHVVRNTHSNTSWDMARFEVAAHKYADLSDNGYGAAVLNNCKYGYRVTADTLDLNLLRSPTHPDPDADMGTHEFTYAFLPHIGSMTDSDVQAEAAMLNRAPVIMTGSAKEDMILPVSVSGNGISLEVLKKAEKDGSAVLRLVETLGRTSKGRIRFNRQFESVAETDLMEWTDAESVKCGGDMEIALQPFEIRTYRLRQSSAPEITQGAQSHE